MFKRLGFQSEEMGLAIMLWLCSLLPVALIIAPLFGLKVAGVVALALFLAAMAICWLLCGWQVIKGRSLWIR